MSYKRILTIQDISCVGQCSMTVALPILSVWGHECCILPTAVLSTHTGGLGTPVVTHLSPVLRDMARHWQEQGITFDAVLIGYLGSIEAVQAAGEILDTMMAPGGVAIVDPAMGDHGRLYSGFDENYAKAVGALCRKADILIPNITEAAILSGQPFRDVMEENYVNQILDFFGDKTVVLTGIGYEKGTTGVVVSGQGGRKHFPHKIVGRPYSGTGDMFAACFTGALMQGRGVEAAAVLAGSFVCRAIENTEHAPAHGYGIKFETALPWVAKQL